MIADDSEGPIITALKVITLATLHALPRPLLPHVLGEIAESAVVAEHEDVVV
jgi:hypothetical protein